MELWQSYDQLCRTAQRVDTAFARLVLPDTRSPERSELVVAFEQASAIMTALADFLEVLDRELVSACGDAPRASSSRDDLFAFVREIGVSREPARADDLPLTPDPRWALPDVIAKLHGFYFFHGKANNHFVDHSMPRTFGREYPWHHLGIWSRCPIGRRAR